MMVILLKKIVILKYKNLIDYLNDNEQYDINVIKSLLSNVKNNNIENEERKINKMKYQCDHCEKEFDHYGNYMRHINRKRPCPCNKITIYIYVKDVKKTKLNIQII